MANLTLEKQLLNCRTFKEDWNLFYGITSKRRDKISCTNVENHDSFFNKNSETALTLFILGNVDGWKQIGALKTHPRRKDKQNDWNEEFFDKIRGSQDVFNNAPTSDVLWTNNRKWKEQIFECEDMHLQKSILLFEFGIPNKAFHSKDDRRFVDLSFLDISRRRGIWSRFDALLIIPSKQRFIFFEAKYKSDESKDTKKYPVSQIIRNLESAFLLTNNQDSLYNNWDFKYVFICPRRIYHDKLTLYSSSLEIDDIKKNISYHKEIIEKNYKSFINKNCYQNYYEFEKETPKRIYKIFWDELGNILQTKHPDFFQNYFNNLSKAGLVEHVENIKERFSIAGIKL